MRQRSTIGASSFSDKKRWNSELLLVATIRPPGIVVSVLVSEGDKVEKGQPLLILEAMKMQNEIEAPISGLVSGVHVSEGATVGNGALLVRLTAEPEE